MVGYYQGTIIVRGAIQRFIHQGTFGVPYLTFIPEQYQQLITKYDY
jgi:hypothetical protein